MKPHVSLIVARARNGVIGKDGQLPWHFPEDLRFFKQTTMGKPIIMGKHTWESIGRPLPGRKNIVLTHDASYNAPGAQVVTNLHDALKMFDPGDEVMIIGGSALYRNSLPLVDTAWITEIDADFEGDTYFDALNPEEWKRVWVEEHPADSTHAWSYRFQRFDRIKHTAY